MILNVKTSTGDYNIVLKRGSINEISQYFDTHKKALVVTDSGVPSEYAQAVAAQFESALIKVIPQGEKSKSFENYKLLLEVLNENEFSRSDCVVAVGGGVVGDLSGFTASTYMRGIAFLNIPTTLLSQVDSSIGGKTAVDFGGYKNTVGAFYQPKAVIIDPDVLKTLSIRQLNNGLAESIKMAATSDSELFSIIESNNAYEKIEAVIERSLKIKKAVVEEDEKEIGLRRVLNFGHTAAHAIETATGLCELLHGECVGIGMLPFSSLGASSRIKNVLEKYSLPTTADVSVDELINSIRHDKKADGQGVNIIFVKEIGSFEFKYMTYSQLEALFKEAFVK